MLAARMRLPKNKANLHASARSGSEKRVKAARIRPGSLFLRPNPGPTPAQPRPNPGVSTMLRMAPGEGNEKTARAAR